jgi:hypothetical protein
MGLTSSITGAGLGFAAYEALTVAYRNHVGHIPSPGERGALAGAIHLCWQGIHVHTKLLEIQVPSYLSY